MADAELAKVTVFITRPAEAGQQLLLFRHPYAGVQVPAGTVEAGETPAAAALREGREESGLEELALHRCLGSQAEPIPAGEARIGARTPIYSRPDRESAAWAYLPRGARVRLLGRFANAFTHVAYEEEDRYPDPQYVTMAITGWAPDAALTRRVRRHFFELHYSGATAASWPVRTDHHTFTAFWATLADLPPVVAPQAPWLAWIRPPAGG